MNKNIESFIKAQKNLTLCTTVNDIPYCANCFYVYISDNNTLVFKSEKKTKHICNALINDKIAGTIIPNISKIGTIKGIQFVGKFNVPEDDFLEHAKKYYYNKYPFAMAFSGDLWGIELLSIKMTDNTLGLGKKVIWEKSISVK